MKVQFERFFLCIYSCLIISTILTQVAVAQSSDLDDGVKLYIEASEALTTKMYPEAIDKFTRAAASLSGNARDNALKMADFVSNMSQIIIGKRLISDERVILVGEVKDENKFWHLYTSKLGFNLLHITIPGKLDMEQISASLGGQFVPAPVIADESGLISQSSAYLPGSQSRIRLWYCGKTDTSHVIYESFQTDQQGELINQLLITKVVCDPLKKDWLYILLITCAGLALFGFAGFRYYQKRKSELSNDV